MFSSCLYVKYKSLFLSLWEKYWAWQNMYKSDTYKPEEKTKNPGDYLTKTPVSLLQTPKTITCHLVCQIDEVFKTYISLVCLV